MTAADIKTLAKQAACFTCLPVNTQQAIKTYLLAVIAGGSRDPKTLLAQSRAFIGIPSGMQPAVQTYATAVLAGGIATASAFVKSQACVFECTPGGLSLPIAIYQLAVKANLAPVPKTLAALAACFVCIPDGYLIALQSYLMAVIAGLSRVPSVLLKAATGFINTIPSGTDPGNTGIAIWISMGGTIPTPTGFSFTEAADNSLVNVSWNSPPSSVTKTELWTSSDNITFSLESTIAAPGTSTTSPTPTLGNSKYGKIRWCNATACGSFTAVQTATNALDPLVVAWRANILSNGGTVTDVTVGIVNTFTVGLRAKASLFSKMIALGPCVGDSLVAGFTPLIIPAGGTNIWTMTGAFPIIANCDFNVNGIRCDFGISAGAGCAPSLMFASTADTGCTFYQFSNDGAHGARTWDWGATIPNEATSQWSGTTSAFGNTYFDCCNAATQFSVPASNLNGYYSWNSTAANARAIYFANSTHAHAAIATSAVVIGGPLPTIEALICGFNNNGVGVAAPSTFSSFRAFHRGLTITESSDLFTLVEAMRVSLGGGFV